MEESSNSLNLEADLDFTQAHINSYTEVYEWWYTIGG